MADSVPWAVRRAARCIIQGGIIAYPTEAVYGLGCDPKNEHAVRRLLQIKRRDLELGLILVGNSIDAFHEYIRPMDEDVQQRVEHSWPGPVTWLLPAALECPEWLTGRHDTIAVRVTAHRLTRLLCQKSGIAIVSTSANLSGRPPARSALQVRRAFGNGVDYIVSGATGGRDRPSEIRDARTNLLIRG